MSELPTDPRSLFHDIIAADEELLLQEHERIKAFTSAQLKVIQLDYAVRQQAVESLNTVASRELAKVRSDLKWLLEPPLPSSNNQEE